MIKIFSTFFLVLVWAVCTGQEFAYKKNSIVSAFNREMPPSVVITHNLINGNDTISVSDEIKSKSSGRRSVSISNKRYSFKYDKSKSQDQILDGKQIVATTQSFYDVTTPEGMFYDNIKINSTQWKYVYNGKDVVRGKFVNESGKKIRLEWLDTSIPDRELIQMMCMVYGANLVQARAKQPYIYMGIVAASILGAVVSQGASSSTN